MSLKTSKLRHAVSAAALAAVAITSIPAHAGKPKPPPAPLARGNGMERIVGAEFDAQRPAVRVVTLSGDFFALQPAGKPLPASIANARVRIDFSGQDATFDDLMLLLEERGLPVVLAWDDGTTGSANPYITNQSSGSRLGNSSLGMQNGTNGLNGNGVNGNGVNGGQVGQNNTLGQGGNDLSQALEAAVEPAEGVVDGEAGAQASPAGRMDRVTQMRQKVLPFRRYEGTLGGLFKRLQRSMGLSIWWNDGIYISTVGRYSVMLPQNREIMAQVANELNAMGARNVVASMQAGTVSFVAPGALAEEFIRPYLIRTGRNASQVTLQVALVSVSMNDSSARGFDWSKFSFSLGDTGTSGTATGGTGGTIGGNVGGGTVTATLPQTNLFSISNDVARVFMPSVLGKPLDIVGAIGFLSSYGNTRVEQNVELKTLSGTRVEFRSGEKIPYVAGVSATVTGSLAGAGTVGAAQTSTLETGLQLDMMPNFEANGGLVTVGFNLQMVDLIEFVTLSAGAQLGTLTQPRTREQRINDIVRVPVGETVVLGGIRGNTSALSRNHPLGLKFLGSKKQSDNSVTTFILLRPSVTTYKVAGLEAPEVGRMSDIATARDGASWEPMEEDVRGSTVFGAPVNAPVKRQRPMAQPNDTTPVGQEIR